MLDAGSLKVVTLPAVIDLDSLDLVRDGLIDAVERGPVSVDASQVERVATNALFMLVSAAETAKRNAFPFAVSGASGPFHAAIDRLGLGPMFSDMLRG